MYLKVLNIITIVVAVALLVSAIAYADHNPEYLTALGIVWGSLLMAIGIVGLLADYKLCDNTVTANRVLAMRMLQEPCSLGDIAYPEHKPKGKRGDNIYNTDGDISAHKAIDYLTYHLHQGLKIIVTPDVVTVGYNPRGYDVIAFIIEEWTISRMDEIIDQVYSSNVVRAIPQEETFILVDQSTFDGNINGLMPEMASVEMSVNGCFYPEVNIKLVQGDESIYEYIGRLECIAEHLGLVSPQLNEEFELRRNRWPVNDIGSFLTPDPVASPYEKRVRTHAKKVHKAAGGACNKMPQFFDASSLSFPEFPPADPGHNTESKEEDGWRDIKSAPKDGTEIMVCARSGNPTRARYTRHPSESDFFCWLSSTGSSLGGVQYWKPLPGKQSGELDEFNVHGVKSVRIRDRVLEAMKKNADASISKDISDGYTLSTQWISTPRIKNPFCITIEGTKIPLDWPKGMTHREYVIPCYSCGRMIKVGAANCTTTVLVCDKCGNKINQSDGRWVEVVPSKKKKLTSLGRIDRVRAVSERSKGALGLGYTCLHEIAGRTLEEDSKCLGICNSESKPAIKEERECLGIATKEMLK